MNSLSWLIYLASVLPEVKAVLATLSAIALTLYFTTMLILSMCEEKVYIKSKWLPVVAAAVLFISAFIPPKETLYLIAGSEAGEVVISSPESQEILDDIQAVIKYQLHQLKGEGN